MKEIYSRVCILDNGTKHDYDAMSIDKERNDLNIDFFKYIGHGKIHSINGVIQSMNTTGYFFKRNDK